MKLLLFTAGIVPCELTGLIIKTFTFNIITFNLNLCKQIKKRRLSLPMAKARGYRAGMIR
ncbi:hypothetical protein [Koleobacter methoxysyntrophicus]|uniref:hypothetical protein n=1 Tax=Koleobacter methoxysyntrophicus TaxID=2751313 RepID=UPI0019D61D9D|nr:hypothetical protein [Koleobacter methoxysyntrophicus]